ncbi:hypothetical protein GCM10023194_39430 [Planotetraspora phitsanulokensis]|uniref:Uncharacterized protein n=1 Tax=Planotetraspora phitsanulokensis TaxID=575192 RepID=A0A8J3UB04_9ACTN|nr:hypothetical protein [Planotetraspora phitsanulokensis]GII41530.1 hypothetical protein Pph01_65330 [Planotetraspora phitsanulokensis]
MAFFQTEISGIAAGADPDAFEELADSLSMAIERIDPSALLDDSGFWRSLLFDVAIGDYCGDEKPDRPQPSP